MGIKIGFTAQLDEALRSHLKSVVKKAQFQAAKELGTTVRLSEELGIVPEFDSILAFTVKKVASDIASDVENNATLPALKELGNGAGKDELIQKVDDSLVSLIEGNALYASTGAVVNQAINTARNNFFWGNKEKIQGFQFSAVMDQKTTAVCASLDQKTFRIEDASALVNRPPLHWNCRSILLPILIGDVEPEWTGLGIDNI